MSYKYSESQPHVLYTGLSKQVLTLEYQAKPTQPKVLPLIDQHYIRKSIEIDTFKRKNERKKQNMIAYAMKYQEKEMSAEFSLENLNDFENLNFNKEYHDNSSKSKNNNPIEVEINTSLKPRPTIDVGVVPLIEFNANEEVVNYSAVGKYIKKAKDRIKNQKVYSIETIIHHLIITVEFCL